MLRSEACQIWVGQFVPISPYAGWPKATLLETNFQARADASLRGHGGSGEQAGEIQDVYFVGQVVALDFKGDVFSFFVVKRGACGCIQGEIWTHTACVE